MARQQPGTRVLLRPLGASDEAEARLAHAELAREGFSFLPGVERELTWSGYLKEVARREAGVDIPPGGVAATLRIAEVDGVLVGRVIVRHELNAALALIGGHIGYAVRPAFRRRGFAVEILRQALVVAGSVGLQRALVTCDDDNVGSLRAIERAGGALDDVVPVPGTAKLKRRYWLPTAR